MTHTFYQDTTEESALTEARSLTMISFESGMSEYVQDSFHICCGQRRLVWIESDAWTFASENLQCHEINPGYPDLQAKALTTRLWSRSGGIHAIRVRIFALLTAMAVGFGHFRVLPILPHV